MGGLLWDERICALLGAQIWLYLSRTQTVEFSIEPMLGLSEPRWGFQAAYMQQRCAVEPNTLTAGVRRPQTRPHATATLTLWNTT